MEEMGDGGEVEMRLRKDGKKKKKKKMEEEENEKKCQGSDSGVFKIILDKDAVNEKDSSNKNERKEHQNEVEFGPAVEKMKMKNKKRNQKMEACSSSAEIAIVSRAVDTGNQRVEKDKRVGNDNERQGGKDSEKVDDITKIKKGKNKRDKEGSDGDSFIMEKYDDTYDQQKKWIARDKDLGRNKDQTDGDSGEMVNVKKIRKKVMKDKDGKDTETGLTEALSRELINGRKKITEDKVVADNDGHTRSNSKKKRKREKEVVDLEPGKDGKKKRKKDKVTKPVGDKGQDKVMDSGKKSIIEDTDGNDSSSTKRGKRNLDSTNVKGNKKIKRVSFSGQVEVFPLPNDMEFGEENNKRPLVQGKRFTPEEDEMVKEAVFNYIKVHGLGEEGVDMVLHCHSHRHIKNCWKDIGSSLPWRPYKSVYHRAHSLFERAEERKWEPEEYDLIRSFHAKHGPKWKTLAATLGKNRRHVKDTWRRIKLPKKKAGFWSQDEYDSLFDLVNKDLQMKAFEEKQSKHGMLRDNIGWEAISDRLGTRTNMTCCKKWYNSLASSMVAKGLWDNADDYRLLEALWILNACCVEDIDWDCLLDDRPGEVCLKRWKQMTKHIGGYKDKPFAEQLELLVKRYCPQILEQEN